MIVTNDREVFFDTNVLVYAAARTGLEEPIRKGAKKLMESEDFGTAAQVFRLGLSYSGRGKGSAV